MSSPSSVRTSSLGSPFTPAPSLRRGEGRSRMSPTAVRYTGSPRPYPVSPGSTYGSEIFLDSPLTDLYGEASPRYTAPPVETETHTTRVTRERDDGSTVVYETTKTVTRSIMKTKRVETRPSGGTFLGHASRDTPSASHEHRADGTTRSRSRTRPDTRSQGNGSVPVGSREPLPAGLYERLARSTASEEIRSPAISLSPSPTRLENAGGFPSTPTPLPRSIPTLLPEVPPPPPIRRPVSPARARAAHEMAPAFAKLDLHEALSRNTRSPRGTQEIPQTPIRVSRNPERGTRDAVRATTNPATQSPQTQTRVSRNPGRGAQVTLPQTPTFPVAPPPTPASSLSPGSTAVPSPGPPFVHGISEAIGLRSRQVSPAFQLTGPDDPDWRTPQLYYQAATGRHPRRFYLIPHPLDLEQPRLSRSNRYYIVTRGQQVGIYGSWVDAGPLVLGIRGNVHQSCSSWEEALNLYTEMYCNGDLVITPLSGSVYNTPVNPGDYGLA